jgi:hypothetical protein
MVKENEFPEEKEKRRYCKKARTVSASLAFSLRDSLTMHAATGTCTIYKTDGHNIVYPKRKGKKYIYTFTFFDFLSR